MGEDGAREGVLEGLRVGCLADLLLTAEYTVFSVSNPKALR